MIDNIPKTEAEPEFKFNKLELAKILRQLREINGISQTKLAKRIGTAQSSISKIESGRIIPDILTILKILRAIDATWQFNFCAASGQVITMKLI